jgi:hypothetical protein
MKVSQKGGTRSQKRLMNTLRRTNRNRNSYPLHTPPAPAIYSLIELINLHSQPLPPIDILKTHTLFITGGIRYGGRYPDIIINYNDLIRAQHILSDVFGSNKVCSDQDDIPTALFSIVDYVRQRFHTSDAVRYKVNPTTGLTNISESWKSTIDMANDCFIHSVFNCNDTNSCSVAKKMYPNTSTNVTALPYLIGDCREHAWLSGFLSYVYFNAICPQNNRQIRILYTKTYNINDTTQTITFRIEHVFVLFYSPSGKIYIIDPLHYHVKPSSGTYAKMNSGEIKTIQLSTLSSYKGFNELITAISTYKRDILSPILETGEVYVENNKIARIMSVPMLYDGSMKFLETPNNLDEDTVLVLNHEYKTYDLEYWDSHKDWCEK